ncbi:MAG: hypothetical protein QXD43_01125 [Candidatus Aenigmatarchaeota archaeon]
MVEKNERPLVPKRRFNPTVKLERSMYIEHFGGAVIDEGDKMIRTPPLLISLNETIELFSKAYPNPSDFPIKYVALVGSFAKVDLNEHLEHFKYVKNNIKDITEEEYDSRLKESLRGFKDYDTFIILKEKTTPQVKFSTLSILKSLLPMPKSIEGLTDGWDIHDESTRDEEQVLEGFKLFETGQQNLLNKHELQFIDKNPNKNIKPVIVYENEYVKLELKEKVEDSLKIGALRTLSDYFSQSLGKYIKEFKNELPKDFEEIVNEINMELESGQYRISKPEQVKQFLTNLTI